MGGWGFKFEIMFILDSELYEWYFHEALGVENGEVMSFKDFKFVPLSFGSQIPLLRAIFHGLGTQNPRVRTLRVQRKTP